MLSNTNVWLSDSEINGTVKKQNLDEIFYQLSSHDDDFNGNNGENYLWEVAKEQGFKTNVDYLVHEVLKDVSDEKEITHPEIQALIDEFLSKWTVYDNYYDGVDFDFFIKNNLLVVAVATATEN